MRPVEARNLGIMFRSHQSSQRKQTGLTCFWMKRFDEGVGALSLSRAVFWPCFNTPEMLPAVGAAQKGLGMFKPFFVIRRQAQFNVEILRLLTRPSSDGG